MEITDVEASSTATSPSPAQQEPSQSSMPPSIPTSRKRKAATTKTNDLKEKPPTIPKEVRKRSWVWNHVTKYTIKEAKEVMKEGKMQKVEVEVLKAKCNYCGQLFACDRSEGGTSTYSKHILRVCKKYVRNDEIHQK
ncbi:hypothetical protein Dimus_024610, partial [Dionaea muscipula]